MLEAPLSAVPRTLGGLLAARASATPDVLAFAGERRRVTSGELADVAGALAGGLARAWASRRVIAWRSSSAAGVGFVEKFWALQLLDAVPCAFNPVTLRRDA